MLIFGLGLLLSCIAILCVNSCVASKKIENYKRYHAATERLLDSLDSEHNWSEYDTEIALDYYEARKKL